MPSLHVPAELVTSAIDHSKQDDAMDVAAEAHKLKFFDFNPKSLLKKPIEIASDAN